MSDRNPTIERPQSSVRDQRESFSDVVRRTNPGMIPSPVLPDAPFDEMVAFVLKWMLAFVVAWVILGIPVGLILYFILR